MLTNPPPQFRKNRRRAKRKAPAGPAPLVLVAASFDPDLQRVSLTFDRDINFADDWQPDQFHLIDGLTTNSEYIGDGDGAGRTGPEFGMIMDFVGAASGGQVLLSVGPGNGLVAADDGGTWSGVTELVLPYPPPAPAQIVSVTHGDAAERVVASLSEPLLSYDDVDKMMGASNDGVNWVYPFAPHDDDPMNIVFVFSVDVSGATQWRVPGQGNWHFANGQILGDPTTGEIE